MPITPPTRQRMRSPESTLADHALKELIKRGSPLLGTAEPCSKHSFTCDWMSKFPDETLLVDMNIPGVHDAATGSYTQEVQDDLSRYTGTIPPANAFKCQQRTFFQMLNDGIRMFDMRIAYNPGNDTLGFYHALALLAPKTTVSDVLYGFYSWLDQHPTETLLMSFKFEENTGGPKDEKLQRMIFDLFSKATDKDPENYLKTKYWSQSRGALGTLGESRGKMILLQRLEYDLLDPAPSDDQLIGIDLGPEKWTSNGKDIKIVYNRKSGDAAYIQDYYYIDPLPDVTPLHDAYISAKYEATIAHLEHATTKHPGQLFIHFASAAYQFNSEGDIIVDPRVFALGDGDRETLLGVNQRLLPWLQHRRGQRFGIILFDFYDAVPGLVEAVIGLNSGNHRSRF